MKLHPRESDVTRAEFELRRFISELVDKEQLTDAEALRVVSAACQGWIGNLAKYMIRVERHGDANKPGGLE